jgi:hypothetical protein
MVATGAISVRPVVVELVGAAATGKTSLLLALARDDRTLRAGLRPPKHRHLPSAVALTPTFLALHRPYRALLWDEMKRITYLRTLQRLLEEHRSTRAGTVVLDEGAVYMLARLLVFGGERVQTPAFQQWWSSAIEQWANILDILVWLDAPDSVLTHRLRTRQQAHPVKALPDEAAAQFMASYRDAYNRVIRALSATPSLSVVSVRTDQEPLSRVAQLVNAEMRKKECGGC